MLIRLVRRCAEIAKAQCATLPMLLNERCHEEGACRHVRAVPGRR